MKKLKFQMYEEYNLIIDKCCQKLDILELSIMLTRTK